MGEIKLNLDAFLVSETDEAGIIKVANDDFCEVAGYELHELLGQPHSIVRHPDMPKAAFEDLWKTVKAGQVWTGLVKNSCKNRDDYYWVFATVYPMAGGYMSCRRMASQEEIERAQALYKTMS